MASISTLVGFCLLILFAGFSSAKPTSEKMAHLHFYFHDLTEGPNRTAVRVAGLPQPPPTGFGTVVMIDDPLTEGPEITSRLVGRAQGMYALAGQQEISLLMAISLAFTQGEYNGSTLSIMGRNPALQREREMAIVGGTGKFRFARGYVAARTYEYNAKITTVEYNAHVLHF